MPTLADYIRIPNKSVAFDPDWETAGHVDAALRLVLDWIRKHPIDDARLLVGEEPGRTPLILIDIPGEQENSVLMYGHLDKQPEMVGWREGLGPWQPKIEDGKLYGRGGADDGYALFASICALSQLQREKSRRARVVVLIEFSEESGSPDLSFWFDYFAQEIGSPNLVICLDSGVGNYDQFWTTTSLRGLISGTLTVRVLKEGVHSGDASGIVPSSFRVARHLLGRLEDSRTGHIIPESLHTRIPIERVKQARDAADDLKSEIWERFPWEEGARPVDPDPVACMLNRAWRPALAITGADGIPNLDDAGNVLRPLTSLKWSLRLPPTVDANQAARLVKELLSQDTPYGVQVDVEIDDASSGWNAPSMSCWLDETLNLASNRYFGRSARYIGEGGSIPFMGMLQSQFPDSQFVVTGVLGPGSNAHGPNEFLHISYAKKLTACIIDVLSAIPSS